MGANHQADGLAQEKTARANRVPRGEDHGEEEGRSVNRVPHMVRSGYTTGRASHVRMVGRRGKRRGAMLKGTGTSSNTPQLAEGALVCNPARLAVLKQTQGGWCTVLCRHRWRSAMCRSAAKWARRRGPSWRPNAPSEPPPWSRTCPQQAQGR